MAAALIYIIRYMRYTRHTPYIWEVVRFALYDRCRFLLEKVIFGLLHLALLGQECTLSVPISYQGLLGKSSRKVALGVPKGGKQKKPSLPLQQNLYTFFISRSFCSFGQPRRPSARIERRGPALGGRCCAGRRLG